MLFSIFFRKIPFSRQNITLFISALFLVLIFLTKWIVFETNDDALMMHIVMGSISGEASPFLLFSNWYWGAFLVELCALLPKLNAYTLVFFVSHIFINYTFNKKILVKELSIIWVIIFTTFQLLLILKLQFTSLAIMLGMTSILLFLDDKYIVAAILLVFSSLIRWEAFLLILLLWSVYVVVEATIRKEYFQLIFFGISVFGAFFLNFQHNDIYEKFAANEALFTPYSAASLRTLMDFGGKIDEKALQSVHWTINDFKVFKQWFWADEIIFSKQHITKLAQATTYDYRLFPRIKHLVHFVVYHFGYCIALALLVFVARKIIFNKKNWLVLLPFIFSLLSFCLLQRFLPRVILPMSIGVFFILLVKRSTKKIVLPSRVWLTILFALFFQIGHFIFENHKSKLEFEVCQTILEKYHDKTILNVQSALNIEGCPIWKNPNTYSNKNFTFVDVLVGYPTYQKFMAIRQITNPFEALYQRDDVYLIANEVANIQQFITEHYHQHTHIDTLEKAIYPNIHLFKLRKIE